MKGYQTARRGHVAVGDVVVDGDGGVLADAEALTVAPSARQMRHDLLVAVGAEPVSPVPVASGAQEAVLDQLRIARQRRLPG
mgnify:CR=1 FL=1